jgi:Zn-dependent alcohol dehydrogenase
MKKAQLIEKIQDFPEEFSLDDLIERLLVLEKIEEGQQQVREGKTLTEEEAQKRLEKWLR